MIGNGGVMTEIGERLKWNGPCIGGPMDGRDGVSRFPSGFLLVDRPSGKCWVYDWLPGDESFLVRVSDGEPLIEDRSAVKNRYRAAEESEFDVIAWEATP
jgi:hypothetical protein